MTTSEFSRMIDVRQAAGKAVELSASEAERTALAQRFGLVAIDRLEAEIALIKPEIIVALGATAAQALLGPQFRVTKQRGEFISSTLARYVMATVHPSSILRAPDDETRQLELRRFVDDLKKLAKLIN